MPATLALVIAVLAVHNVVGNLWAPAWAYVPLNVTVGAVLVLVGRRAGLRWEEIGGPRRLLGTGLAVGAALGAVVVAVMAAATQWPAVAGAFEDDRVLDTGNAALAFSVLVRLPIGTALFEEVAFRGVLQGIGRRLTTPVRAAVLSASLFGLWHVIPATATVDGNEAISSAPIAAAVVASVAATTVVGLGFSWLRERFGLAAPVTLHAVVNAAAFAIAWLVA